MENYKGYVINTREDTEKGIFFRSPIQKVLYDADDDDSQFSAWDYISKIKDTRFRVFQRLLGNGDILKNIKRDSKDPDWEGFHANILCFPIYFKRNFRYLEAIAEDSESNVQLITSYGYESEFKHSEGSCEFERTTFVMKNKSTVDNFNFGRYHYTFRDIIQKLIDEDFSNQYI